MRQPDVFAVIAEESENPVNQRCNGAEAQAYRDIKRCGEKVPILKPIERAQADKAKRSGHKNKDPHQRIHRLNRLFPAIQQLVFRPDDPGEKRGDPGLLEEHVVDKSFSDILERFRIDKHRDGAEHEEVDQENHRKIDILVFRLDHVNVKTSQNAADDEPHDEPPFPVVFFCVDGEKVHDTFIDVEGMVAAGKIIDLLLVSEKEKGNWDKNDEYFPVFEVQFLYLFCERKPARGILLVQAIPRQKREERHADFAEPPQNQEPGGTVQREPFKRLDQLVFLKKRRPVGGIPQVMHEHEKDSQPFDHFGVIFVECCFQY